MDATTKNEMEEKSNHKKVYWYVALLFTLVVIFVSLLVSPWGRRNINKISYFYKWKVKPGSKPERPENYTGIWRDWYENGQIASEVYYSNGKPHGKCITWYENGVVKTKVFAISKGVEKLVFYYGNGIKEREIHCKNGKKDGITRWWGTDGTLYGECIYEDGYPKEGTVFIKYDRGCIEVEVYEDFKLKFRDWLTPWKKE